MATIKIALLLCLFALASGKDLTRQLTKSGHVNPLLSRATKATIISSTLEEEEQRYIAEKTEEIFLETTDHTQRSIRVKEMVNEFKVGYRSHVVIHPQALANFEQYHIHLKVSKYELYIFGVSYTEYPEYK